MSRCMNAESIFLSCTPHILMHQNHSSVLFYSHVRRKSCNLVSEKLRCYLDHATYKQLPPPPDLHAGMLVYTNRPTQPDLLILLALLCFSCDNDGIFQAPKDPKMPYVMLQGLRKKAKQREEQREAMEAEAGVITGNAGSARRKSAQTSRGRGGGGGGSGGGSRGGGNDRGGGSSRCVIWTTGDSRTLLMNLRFQMAVVLLLIERYNLLGIFSCGTEFLYHSCAYSLPNIPSSLAYLAVHDDFSHIRMLYPTTTFT